MMLTSSALRRAYSGSVGAFILRRHVPLCRDSRAETALPHLIYNTTACQIAVALAVDLIYNTTSCQKNADSGWQLVSLTEIITTPAVKKVYGKATLYVHPVKLQQIGASIQQKLLGTDLTLKKDSNSQ
ncbi:auxilin-like protein 1 [Tanacetum coccineum]